MSKVVQISPPDWATCSWRSRQKIYCYKFCNVIIINQSMFAILIFSSTFIPIFKVQTLTLQRACSISSTRVWWKDWRGDWCGRRVGGWAARVHCGSHQVDTRWHWGQRSLPPGTMLLPTEEKPLSLITRLMCKFLSKHRTISHLHT